jgi:hypothetical protein
LRAALKLDRSLENASSALRDLLLQQGRVNEVISMLQDMARLSPFEMWIPVEIARLEVAKSNKEGAREAYEQALAVCPEEASICARYAHSMSLFDDNETAVRLLERAVMLDPKDRTSRRYLEYLRSNVKPFEDPFRVDAVELLKNKDLPRVAAADEPLEVDFQQVAYKLNPDGTTQRYEHLVATVLNEDGAKRLDGHFIPHDPGDEQVRIRRARVIRKDGRIDDAPSPPGSSYVNFPPLAVGDSIDVEARIDTIRVGIFGNYFGTRHLFHGLGVAPTRLSEQIYLAPTGRKLHFSKRNGAPEPVVSEARHRVGDAERARVRAERFGVDLRRVGRVHELVVEPHREGVPGEPADPRESSRVDERQEYAGRQDSRDL